MKQLMHHLKNHGLLLIILAIFSALTLYQSVVLPLGEAADETDHYQYLRFVARTGHPPFTEAERRKAGFKGGLAPLYYRLTAWPIAWVGEETLPDIRRVDSRPQRHLPGDGLGINHVLHTLDEQQPWRGQPLAWHLVRLLSLPMGWVTIIATYALTRRLFAARFIAVGAAAFVALLPRFVFSAAVINDDNLVFALIALLLLVQVILLQEKGPPSLRLMAAFGALFGLALITKYFSLILLPEILLTLWFIFKKRFRATSLLPTPYSLLPVFCFLFPLFLTAGMWFIFIVIRFNRVAELGWLAGLAASLGEPQITEGLRGLLTGQAVRPPAATYSLLEWLGLLYRSFWFEFGWMRVFAPAWVYWLFSLFSGLALLGLGKMLLATRKATGQNSLPAMPVTLLLALHLTLFVIVVIVRYILSATIDTGQGRHLYPALPVIALLTSLGGYGLVGRLTAAGQPTPQPHATRYPPGSAPQYRALAAILLVLTFLLPSFAIHNPQFTIDHYHTHPVTTSPVPLPTARRLDMEFEPGLSLVGFDAPPSVSAGEALPVTLVWQARQPGQQTYLVSVCLEDNAAQPVACARTRFEDGRYPPPAWEPGDTLIDTVHLPVPVCYRLPNQRYTLSLRLWRLDATAPTSIPIDPPILEHRAEQMQITIRPTDSLRDQPQTRDLWLDSSRLTAPAALTLGQSLTQISYAAADKTSPQFVNVNSGTVWQPLTTLNTNLYLPCDDGPTPFAKAFHFIVDATLPPGQYAEYSVQNTDGGVQNIEEGSYLDSVLCPLYSERCSSPPVSLNVRQRQLAPITNTLTFNATLAPLMLTAQHHIIQLEPVHAETPTERIELPAGEPLPAGIAWQAQRRMPEPLVIALKLIDKNFGVGGARIATLGDRYPNVLWQPGELVKESYPVQPAPNAPPGLYRLELGLLRQDDALPAGYENLPVLERDTVLGNNLYPLAVRLLDVAHGTPPPNRLDAVLGDTIRLTGYKTNPLPAGSPKTVALTLYWESTDKIEKDYTVFTQLLGPDGQVWAQWDNPPQAGRYPTSAWKETDSVVDRYTLTLREGAPPGEYRLLAGMYEAAGGERLPVSINDRPQPNNAVQIDTFNLMP